MSEQLSLFDAKHSDTQQSHHYWQLFIDGASRRNPGPAGVGIYLLKDTVVVLKKGFFIGTKTNNQAEYRALLVGLFFLRQYVSRTDVVLISSDSELMIKQLKGIYKIKNAALKPLYHLAQTLLSPMQYELAHVLREHNTHADEMANYGIDKKNPLPDQFIALLREHDIPV